MAKRAALMAGRYAHAKQFKRRNRELKFLRTRLGRPIRDTRRKVAGDDETPHRHRHRVRENRSY